MISEARELILIDTCVWAAFFSRSDSTEKRAVTELVRTDRAAIIGPIGAEVLRGFRRDAEADWASAALEGVHYFELDWDLNSTGMTGVALHASAGRQPRRAISFL